MIILCGDRYDSSLASAGPHAIKTKPNSICGRSIPVVLYKQVGRRVRASAHFQQFEYGTAVKVCASLGLELEAPHRSIPPLSVKGICIIGKLLNKRGCVSRALYILF